MKKFYRCHYLTVLFSLKKYFWVLLIPVVRTVLAVGFDYHNAFKGYEADIFLLSMLLLYAFTRWLFTSVQINAENITIRKGIIFQKTVKVCDENISCIKLWYNPFSVIFSCFILRVYENPTKKPIISIYLSKKAVDEVRKKYFSEEDKLCSYKTKPIFHALVFGGNKGGFLLISALFSFSGIATGKTLRKLAEENMQKAKSPPLWGGCPRRGRERCNKIFRIASVVGKFVLPTRLFRHALRHATFPRGEGLTDR